MIGGNQLCAMADSGEPAPKRPRRDTRSNNSNSNSNSNSNAVTYQFNGIQTVGKATDFLRLTFGKLFQPWHECFTRVLPPKRYASFMVRLLNETADLDPKMLFPTKITDETAELLLSCGLANDRETLKSRLTVMEDDLVCFYDENRRKQCATELVDLVIHRDDFLEITPLMYQTKSKLFEFFMKILSQLPPKTPAEIQNLSVDLLCGHVSDEEDKKYIRTLHSLWNPYGNILFIFCFITLY